MFAYTLSCLNISDNINYDNFIIFICSINFLFIFLHNLKIIKGFIIYYAKKHYVKIMSRRAREDFPDFFNSAEFSRNFDYKTNIYLEGRCKEVFKKGNPEQSRTYSLWTFSVALFVAIELYLDISPMISYGNIYVILPLGYLLTIFIKSCHTIKREINELLTDKYVFQEIYSHIPLH